MAAPKKVVLAYSGGLDTSIILKWLQRPYGCEVVTFTADLGQGEELEPAREKAELLGVKPATSSSRTCARNSSATSSSRCSAPTPSTRASYLLGTSIARPLIAKRLVEIARGRPAPTPSPTAPPARATTRSASSSPPMRSNPAIKVIAPWREWDLTSRTKLLEYAEQHQIPIAKDKRGEAPYSIDAQPAAHLLRGQGARGSRPRRRRPTSTSAPVDPEEAPDTPSTSRSASSRATRSRRRRGAVAGRAADAAERARRRGTASAGSTSSRTASSA